VISTSGHIVAAGGSKWRSDQKQRQDNETDAGDGRGAGMISQKQWVDGDKRNGRPYYDNQRRDTLWGGDIGGYPSRGMTIPPTA
jgi:hypothetical protein